MPAHTPRLAAAECIEAGAVGVLNFRCATGCLGPASCVERHVTVTTKDSHPALTYDADDVRYGRGAKGGGSEAEREMVVKFIMADVEVPAGWNSVHITEAR